MSNAHQSSLDWVAAKQEDMLEMVLAWSRINSGSYHHAGILKQADAMEHAFKQLKPTHSKRIELPPLTSVNSNGDTYEIPIASALNFRKHENAPLKILLCGHMDTVFPKEHTFQTPMPLADGRINGPGVADMKGGIVVMLHALMALEASPYAGKIGWEVLLNPDEEIGSISSAPELIKAAKRNQFGMIYEPCLPDGTMAGARKGSGNFTAVVRGRAAHAGRNPEEGRNAIAALAEFITVINALNGQEEGLTVNPGKIEGGGPVNVVPDLAICRFNTRVATPEQQHFMEQELAKIVKSFEGRDGLALELHGSFTRPPKILSPANEFLFATLKECGATIGVDVAYKTTGGCCDGNNLAAAGLPNIDTLGVRGGDIHSRNEYFYPASLTERAQLSALLLLRFASGEVAWPTT